MPRMQDLDPDRIRGVRRVRTRRFPEPLGELEDERLVRREPEEISGGRVEPRNDVRHVDESATRPPEAP